MCNQRRVFVWRSFPIAGVLIFGLALNLSAEEKRQDPQKGKLKFTTDRVVIFKDGFALFVKHASGTVNQEGRVFTDQVPDGAVLGTFWAATGDHRALGMRAEWIDRKEIRTEKTACLNTLELLRANKGRNLTLRFSRQKVDDLECKIVEVLEIPSVEPKIAAAPHTPVFHSVARFHHAPMRPSGAPVANVREIIPHGGELVVVETQNGRMVLPVREVRALSGTDLITTMIRTKEVKSRFKRLSFDVGKELAGKPVKIQLLYFSEGVRWIPTYRIAGMLEKDATISLQGEILNEAEDFDCEVDLVVGVPNFRFKNVVSPLSLERTLRKALVQAAPNLMGQRYSNASFQSRRTEHLGGHRGAAAGRADLNLAPELSAAQQQDLFVYSAKRLRLKKGSRATVPLWQSKVPLRHLYTMDIKVVRDPHSGSAFKRNSNGVQSPMNIEENKVWHQFELENSSKVPWTTGAALILKKHLPLGQDLLTYTPAGGKVLLPVTVAVNMCGTYREEEVFRKSNALTWNRNAYAEVRKRASLTVINQGHQVSKTRVTIGLGGRVDANSVSDKGTVRINDFRMKDWNSGGYRVVNNHSDISWELDIAPGEKKVLTFEFVMYIR